MNSSRPLDCRRALGPGHAVWKEADAADIGRELVFVEGEGEGAGEGAGGGGGGDPKGTQKATPQPHGLYLRFAAAARGLIGRDPPQSTREAISCTIHG